MTEAADSQKAYKSKHDAITKAEVREVSKPKKWSWLVPARHTQSRVEPLSSCEKFVDGLSSPSQASDEEYTV